jgi:hypothetical protein
MIKAGVEAALHEQGYASGLRFRIKSPNLVGGVAGRGQVASVAQASSGHYRVEGSWQHGNDYIGGGYQLIKQCFILNIEGHGAGILGMRYQDGH